MKRTIEFSIDFVNEYNNYCTFEVELKYDRELSKEYDSPTWVVINAESDSDYPCELDGEFEEGFHVGIQDVKKLIELEKEGFNDCWDPEYYKNRNFDYVDEANLLKKVTDDLGNDSILEVNFLKRKDNGLWQIVDSSCNGNFKNNPSDEFRIGSTITEEELDTLF